jgi:hypothetical protein
MKWKRLLAVIPLAALIATPAVSRAEDITRFVPLKADEVTRRKRPGPR